MEYTNTKPSNMMETDGNDSVFQTYVPKSLFGIVDVIVQLQSNIPQSYKVLPNGKIELQFLLEGSDVLDNKLAESSGNNSQFSYLFSATSKPHYPSFKKINMVLIIMSPIAVKALFGLPARELYNNIMSLIITKVHLSPTMSKAEVQGQLHLN